MVGFEPTTNGFGIRYSNQLSYIPGEMAGNARFELALHDSKSCVLGHYTNSQLLAELITSVMFGNIFSFYETATKYLIQNSQ